MCFVLGVWYIALTVSQYCPFKTTLLQPDRCHHNGRAVSSMLGSSKKQITAPCEDNELLQDIQTTVRGQAQALSNKKIDR